MDVTDILRDRMQEPAGLQKMVSVSLLLHGALIAGLLFAPRGLFIKAADAPRAIMTISLGGGGDGPSNGGLTSIGGRPVQVQTPEETKRDPVRPPAAKAPEMTAAGCPAPSRVKAAAPSVKAPDEARGRTPTRGAEERPGTAVVETGARGMGFGLSTGGGARYRVDARRHRDFCCPDYVVADDRTHPQKLESAGGSGRQRHRSSSPSSATGRSRRTSVEKSSGQLPARLRRSTRRPITRKLPPLPPQFPEPTLTVHLNFQYQR